MLHVLGGRWRASGLLVLALTLVTPIFGAASARRDGPDVYVVYSGRSRAAKKELLSKLSKDLSVSTYNVDLLALADYSGRQKAVAKIERAPVIVFLGDGPNRYLKGSRFRRDILMVQTVRKDVRSSGWILYIVDSETPTEALKDIKTLQVGKASDLADYKTVRSYRALVVDKSSLGVNEAAAGVLELIKKHKKDSSS